MLITGNKCLRSNMTLHDQTGKHFTWQAYLNCLQTMLAHLARTLDFKDSVTFLLTCTGGTASFLLTQDEI